MENITQYKLKVSAFASELDGEIDRDLRTVLNTEIEVYEVGTVDNGDGEFDKIYKSKVVGATDITQSNQKVVKGKSKRSASKKLRQALYCINPDEEYYQLIVNKIIFNLEDVIQYLNDK